MQRKPLFWFLVSLVCLGGAVYFWRLGDEWRAQKTSPTPAVQPAAPAPAKAAATGVQSNSAPKVAAITPKPAAAASASKTNRYPYRLANTDQSLKQLIHNDKAILLQNALIDTGKPMHLAIPSQLQASAGSGTYVVQSRGALDDPFRAALRNADAAIISYIPNNAYLVRVSDTGAQQLSANPQTQSVLPYQPYYKLDPSLLKMAIEQPDAVPANGLNVTVFPDAYQATMDALQQLGANVVSQDRSPFGPVLKVQPATGTLSAVASLPGVQIVAPSHARILGNDIDRPTLGVAADSITPDNYLNLLGDGVLVNINDGAVDANHPDLTGRLTSDFPFALIDTDGHGTHVAGTILGNGSQSPLTNTPQGSVTNATFRGMAPNAKGFVMSIFSSSDSYLQETAARTNAFISNNSWNYEDSSGYDIEAASYDAAVRDALPEVTGSQAMVYVFSAGNNGAGDDSGTGGNSDSVLSPATAKNVITVGAVEEPRDITNLVVVDGQTNSEMFDATDNGDQVAGFSSRGNVGISIEGNAGRFKPDVVAPGTFVISDRSTTWDTASYYNPTNYQFNSFPNQNVLTNSLTPQPPIFVQDNAIQLILTVSSNVLSPSPFPALPIYVKLNSPPTTNSYDFLGFNSVSLPPNLALNAGESVYWAIGNPTNIAVNFDTQTELITTNDNGDYFTVLSNLNETVAPFYRFESGTSMAAAGVSGMLACMQQFFVQHKTSASPALMKALVINGARTLGQPYDFQSSAPNGNLQGWGLANLPNSLPPTFTNWSPGNANTMPLQFRDQDPNQALATGQSKTFNIKLTADATQQDLHITLVWTDPPGNPAAGTKLVNDLDLVVTNLDPGDGSIFFGNDFQAGLPYSESWDTNGPPNIDSVNNVENIYIGAPLGSNYSITVYARRVNVNAVTANTNNIVQDYALVVSSGDSGSTVTTPFTMTDANGGAIVANNTPTVIGISNALPVFNQRVGANSQFSATTNGTVTQWNFYTYTNTPALTNAAYTNVAILTFVSPNLSVPRMGASTEVAYPDPNATRSAGADIDLYVSTNPNLTNLDTNVIANSVASGLSSTSRTGAEKVLITGSTPGQVYYIGVKSEDQNGAQFDIVGVATQLPFSQTDGNGNTVITLLTSFPLPIPGGSPSAPQAAVVLGVSTSPSQVRKVVVTNSVSAADFGDYLGTLNHSQHNAVLNNHTFFDNGGTNETFVYDDSGENEFPRHRVSAGPGTLRNFTGDTSSDGIWMFTMVNDSSPVDTGNINNFSITVEPQPPTNGFPRTIAGNSWFYDFVEVPDNATNLTVTVTGNSSPVDLFIKAGDYPSFGDFDNFAILPGNGVPDSLSINEFSSPPLNPGIYFFGVYNPSPSPQSVFITVEVDLSLAPVSPLLSLSPGNEPIPDDAVMYSTNHVGVDSLVVSADVGVRIAHPRESDLVLTLISPDGTRVLLAENRGGNDTNGYGTGFDITNAAPPGVAGDVTANTNIFGTVNNSGTLIINYQFFTIPDDMRVYYDGQRIFDSGLVSGGGTFAVDFGPGASTNIEILMNEAGTNPNTNGDQWNYTATVVTRNTTYAFFTENTNLTTLPIKFAVPPFGRAGAVVPAALVDSNSFEGIPATNYVPGSFVDGWEVVQELGVHGTRNPAVLTVPALANSGTNVLALHAGVIARTLPTIPGRNYTMRIAYHGRPSLAPISWWKGEGGAASNYIDNANGGNNLATINQKPVPSSVTAVVGQGIQFAGSFFDCDMHLPDPANLQLTNAITLEGWIAVEEQAGTIFERGDNTGQDNAYHLGMSATVNNQLEWYVTGANHLAAPVAIVQVPVTLTAPIYQYVTATYNSANSNLNLFINSVLVDHEVQPNMPIGALNPANLPGVGLGNSGTSDTNKVFDSPFFGVVDEFSVYDRELSQSEIEDIYAAGSAGKDYPVGTVPPVTATIGIGSLTNTITALDQWITNIITFTADNSNMVVTITPTTNLDQTFQDGVLLDSFQLVENSTVNPANYYLPEESLNKVAGQDALGDWKLEVLDNRAGATNPPPLLLSWELSLILANKVPAALPLAHGITQSNAVPPGSISYFIVDVPPWASYATNILQITGGGGALLFNQYALPGTNASDVNFFGNVGVGTYTRVLSNALPGAPLLLPGQRYYLGLTNPSPTVPLNYTLTVDFDIYTLTNAVAVTNNAILVGNVPRYYQFDVDTNAQVTTFQILNPTGNAEMVVSKGTLPDTANYNYLNVGSNSFTIAVSTNSVPVPLSAGRWYIGVFNDDVNTINYTIVATEAGPPTIISLTNGVPFNFSSQPGPPITNFFLFSITNSVPAALFELYNLSGNVDLTLDRNAFPYLPPYLGQSVNLGTNSEQIVIRTNILGTNIIDNWYLGVPNNTAGVVTYTIRATVSTNGLLIGYQPLKIQQSFPPPGSPVGPTITWPGVQGETYEVQSSSDLINWTTIQIVIGTGTLETFVDPNPLVAPNSRFYRIIQIP